MIKPVEYNGYLWKVTFQYTPDKKACAAQGGPNITHCMILPHPVPEGEVIAAGIKAGVGMLVGVTKRAATDKPSYEIGRKLSLARALQGAPKEFRRAVWQAYLGRKKGQ